MNLRVGAFSFGARRHRSRRRDVVRCIQRCRKSGSLMRTGTVKGSLRLFGIIAVGTALFGLWQGYGIGETLIAAVILSAFVVGIAWIGARADSRFNRK